MLLTSTSAHQGGLSSVPKSLTKSLVRTGRAVSGYPLASKLVYGIDVGTTKIVAIAGRADGRRGWVEVLSMGEAPSHGLKRGIVVDREAAAESVAEAIEACGVRGGPVSVGIAGSHISSVNTEVTLLNRSRNLMVTDRFVRKLEQEA